MEEERRTDWEGKRSKGKDNGREVNLKQIEGKASDEAKGAANEAGINVSSANRLDSHGEAMPRAEWQTFRWQTPRRC